MNKPINKCKLFNFFLIFWNSNFNASSEYYYNQLCSYLRPTLRKVPPLKKSRDREIDEGEISGDKEGLSTGETINRKTIRSTPLARCQTIRISFHLQPYPGVFILLAWLALGANCCLISALFMEQVGCHSSTLIKLISQR